MLFIFVLILLLGLLCFFSFPVLETFLSFIVLTEGFFYLLGVSNIPYGYSVFLSFLLSGASCYYIQKKFKENKKEERRIIKQEFEFSLFFLISFIILYAISISHADFIALGERLRDYGILSSVVASPIFLKESWFAGFELNYYGFWYRLGSIIHYALGYKTWDVYHILISLNTSFYVSFLYLILRKYLKLNFFLALFCTFIIFPGSNFNGIKFFFTDDTNWWGPSRVIKGAITEFPMWSYILGDAHPHFLNLLLFPFLISFMLFLDPLSFGKKEKIFFFFLILFLPLNILANSNPWDLPVYLMLFTVMVAYILGVKFIYKKDISIKNPKSLNKDFFGFCIFLFIVISFSLFLSSRNISPTTTDIQIVKAPVLRTELKEFFDAFLFPVCFIFIGNLFLFEKKYRATFFFLVLLSIFLQPFLFDIKENQSLCVLPLIIIFIYNMYRLVTEAKDFNIENDAKRKNIIFESIGVASLLIWIVPEFIYLNDSYGAGNERMNTIFKLYSVGWALAYIFSFYILNRVKEKYQLKASAFVFIIPLMIVSILCFFKLTNIRYIQNGISIEDRKQGLTEIGRWYNGAKETITAFRELPRGTVMESTKGAYNYASFVATLSDKDSYLGWLNHVGLLYKKDNENMERVRRENDIRRFYTEFSCDERKAYLRENNIKYAVLGPLEREEFRERLNNDFYCLKNIIQYGDFVIFSSED